MKFPTEKPKMTGTVTAIDLQGGRQRTGAAVQVGDHWAAEMTKIVSRSYNGACKFK
jgi:hypothetical protein